MNALATEVSPLTVESALAAVKGAVVQLRTIEAEHLSNEASVARGRSRLEAAAAAVAEIETANAQAITRHAKRLEEQTRSGSSAPPPQLVPSDQHIAKQLIASRTLTATQQMLQTLQTTVAESATKVQSVRLQVTAALARLREVEIHDRIHRGLELVAQAEVVIAEILVRSDTGNGSGFGQDLHDRDTQHQLLRVVWDAIEAFRLPNTRRDQLGAASSPRAQARAALAKRDQELLTSKEEPTP